MKKVVVTGASGFIGKALTKKLLEKKIEVFAIVRDCKKMDEFKDDPLISIVEADLKGYSNIDESRLSGDVDVFYHLAWEGTFGAPFKDYKLQMNNSIYSADALDLAIRSKSKKFVMASTVNVLETINYFGKSGIAPRYTCIYGTAKLASEMICKTIAYQKGIDINVALIANSYGEGDTSKMLPNVLLTNLLQGKSPDLVEGNFLYDWIYIEDIVEGLLAIGEKGLNQKTYYVGHENLLTFREIVENVRDIVNPNVELKLGVYSDTVNIDYERIDRTSLRKDTGFSPCSDFKESILNTVNWIKKR